MHIEWRTRRSRLSVPHRKNIRLRELCVSYLAALEQITALARKPCSFLVIRSRLTGTGSHAPTIRVLADRSPPTSGFPRLPAANG